MPNDRASRLFRFTYILVLTIVVAGGFLYTIRGFVVDLFLAAIFAGLLYPLFDRSLHLFGGRRTLTATAIVIAAVFAVVVPFALIATMVWSEAVQLSATTAERIRPIVDDPQQLLALLPRGLTDNEAFQRALASFAAQTNDIIAAVAGFLSRTLSSVALGAARTLLDLFVIGLAIITFLQSGPALVREIAGRSPVGREELRKIADNTLRITAATLKGIVIVGGAQGTLVGLGFAVAGISQPWFWGAVAAAASLLPVLGAGLVWAPAAIYLILSGDVTTGLGLALWGLAVVATVDNFLRAYVVGRDAEMPSLLVFVSTFGGLATFGASGILIGPVLAGTFLGVLDVYRSVLKSSGVLDGGEKGDQPPADSGTLMKGRSRR
jgi:predicted PurR-regulated permease PerM